MASTELSTPYHTKDTMNYLLSLSILSRKTTAIITKSIAKKNRLIHTDTMGSVLYCAWAHNAPIPHFAIERLSTFILHTNH